MFPLSHAAFDETVEELAEVRRLRRLIQLPAYIWERDAEGRCDGNCEEPSVLAITPGGTFQITCCEMMPVFEQFKMLQTAERVLRAKLHGQAEAA